MYLRLSWHVDLLFDVVVGYVCLCLQMCVFFIRPTYHEHVELLCTTSGVRAKLGIVKSTNSYQRSMKKSYSSSEGGNIQLNLTVLGFQNYPPRGRAEALK